MNSKENQEPSPQASGASNGQVVQKDSRTAAQILFGGKTLLTERPKEMVFADYKTLLKHQNFVLKKVLAGSPRQDIARLMETRFGYNNHIGRQIFKEMAAAATPTKISNPNQNTGAKKIQKRNKV